MKKFIVLTLVLLLAACGKKGPLVYPEALVPAQVTNLKVEQKGERFQISWSQPAREEGGDRLKDLAGFRLFRREVLPPGEDCEECPKAYRLITTVDAEYPQGVVRWGDLYFFSDAELAAGKTYQYKVVSFKRDGAESSPSNRTRKKWVAPPRAPELKALSGPTSVLLTWEPAPLQQNAALEGYNVYRKRPGGILPPKPLNGSPLGETRFEDLSPERGTKYGYAVRTVARMDGEMVESGPSNEAEGELTEPE
jgi:predicted small lipoprotein YifL